MPTLSSSPRPTIVRPSRLPRSVRWMLSFVGFPIGGLVAQVLVGPVDDVAPALLGGLITGLSVGAAQAWGLALDRRTAIRCAATTGVGFMIGLGLGAPAVGYETTLPRLVVQGAICGVAVGVAQVGLIRTQGGRPVLVWPVVLGAIWALGWAVTTAVGIDVGRQFTVFGSSGAVVVTALTGVALRAVRRSQTRPVG